MSSQVKTFEDVSYGVICESIMEQGRDLWGPSGYSRIIFTNGCFDILHPGHLKIIRECRSLAGPKGAVVIGVNSDSSVRRLKGDSRPIMDESSRCNLLVNLRQVDCVVTFDEDTPIKLIDSLRPDMIVKGGDYRAVDVVGSHLASVVIIPVETGYSTSMIVEKIRRG